MKNNPKKLQILKTAYKRFVRHGLSKTTIEEIARDLRIGKATIYHYFNSKEDIFYEVLRSEIDKFINEISEIFNSSETELSQKFLFYFNVKKKIRENYSLIHELLLIIINGNPLEKDIKIYNFLKSSEEKALAGILNKNGKLNKDILNFLILQSWSFSFISSFDSNEENAEQNYSPVLTDIFKVLFT